MAVGHVITSGGGAQSGTVLPINAVKLTHTSSPEVLIDITASNSRVTTSGSNGNDRLCDSRRVYTKTGGVVVEIASINSRTEYLPMDAYGIVFYTGNDVIRVNYSGIEVFRDSRGSGSVSLIANNTCGRTGHYAAVFSYSNMNAVLIYSNTGQKLYDGCPFATPKQDVSAIAVTDTKFFVTERENSLYYLRAYNFSGTRLFSIQITDPRASRGGLNTNWSGSMVYINQSGYLKIFDSSSGKELYNASMPSYDASTNSIETHIYPLANGTIACSYATSLRDAESSSFCRLYTEIGDAISSYGKKIDINPPGNGWSYSFKAECTVGYMNCFEYTYLSTHGMNGRFYYKPVNATGQKILYT